jgi:hypothetical protein
MSLNSADRKKFLTQKEGACRCTGILGLDRTNLRVAVPILVSRSLTGQCCRLNLFWTVVERLRGELELMQRSFARKVASVQRQITVRILESVLVMN